MCSIVASFDFNKVRELVELNRYRGSVAHSMTCITPEGHVVYRSRGIGDVDIDKFGVDEGNGLYVIVHQQAPTDTDPTVGVHPAEVYADYLWHNGILKPSTIEYMAESIGHRTHWDTKLLAYWLAHNQKLDERVDGSFACMRYAGDEKALYAFRNEIAPLFIDKDLTISSTKADGLWPLPPNIMWKLDLKNRAMSGVDTFITANNPYFFHGDLVGNEPKGPSGG